MSHSPEPWSQGEEHEVKCDIEDSAGKLVGSLRYPLLASLQGSDNSERIVACRKRLPASATCVPAVTRERP